MLKRFFLKKLGSNMSLSSANTMFNFSNVILIVGAALVLFGTVGAIWAGGIRDRYSDERIAHNESETAKANEGAAKANLKSVEIEKENLELRRKFANRRITENQHKILVDILSKEPHKFDIETMSDPESGLYAADILKTLTDAGWTVEGKSFPMGVVWTGLNIFLTADPAALELANAFRSAEIPFAIGNEQRARVTIMIGGKPPVF